MRLDTHSPRQRQQNLFSTLELVPVPETGWTPPKEFPRLEAAQAIAVDLETYDPNLLTHGPGWGRHDGHIVGIAVGVPTGERWYLPMRHELPDGSRAPGNLDAGMVLKWAQRELGRTNQPKIGANLEYDVGWLAEEGVQVTGELIDVQYAAALLNEHRNSYSLDNLAKDYLGDSKVDDALYDWLHRAYGGTKGRAQAKNIYRSPLAMAGPYAEGDVDLPLRLWEVMRPALEAEGLADLMRLECDLIPILVAMRMRGTRVDVARAEQVREQLLAEEAGVVAQLKRLTGFEVNVEDKGHLQRAFDAAGIAYPRTDKGNPSFRQEFLDTCPGELGKLIRAKRRAAKARGTFIEGYILDKHVDGIIHGSFHPLRKDEAGTVSGRFSASNPNLQNIPSRDKAIKQMTRGLFLPWEGDEWHSLDYSQIEYRFLAHYAMGDGAEELREVFRNDPQADFHEQTRQLILQVTGKELERKPTKSINFGLCIAEGQRVLTHIGLVPIEAVEDWHMLWDGVEWITHDGVVCNGTKEVITHDGLTATPDHVVWNKAGYQVPLWRCASEGAPIARSGAGTVPLRAGNAGDLTGHHQTLWEPPQSGRPMQLLRESKDVLRGQLTGKEDHDVRLPAVPQVPEPVRQNTGPALRRHGTTVPHRSPRELTPLQGPWHQGPVSQSGAFHPVGTGDVPGDGLQGAGLRPDRQRGALQPGELAAGNTVGEHPKRQAVVYDIVNAGPRHRFTVEGRLVHNCYGMGEAKLKRGLGLSNAEADELFNAYHQGAPFVKYTYLAAMNRAAERGYIRTILGRRARFPMWEARDWDTAKREGDLPYDQAAEKWGASRIKRSRTHKTLNALLQGSSADMIKAALVKVYKEMGIVPLNTVHDENNYSLPEGPEGREMAWEIKRMMEQAVNLRVPVICDADVGPNWADLSPL